MMTPGVHRPAQKPMQASLLQGGSERGGAGPFPGSLLLYDGRCGFCSGMVEWIRRRDRKGRIAFVPGESPEGIDALSRYPECQDVDSVVWIGSAEGGSTARAATRSEAVIRALVSLGGVWRLASAARIIPRPLRDALYNLVARNRHRLSPHRGSCRT